MGEKYLDAAKEGKNEWWRYLLSVVVVFVMWVLIGSCPGLIYFIAVSKDGLAETLLRLQSGELTGGDPLGMYLVLNIAFVFLVVGIWLAVRLVHQRRFLSLITPTKSINWKRVATGFVVWFLLAGVVASFFEALIYPGTYSFVLDWPKFLMALPLVLILTPIQTTAEELLFRGYLLQGFGNLVRKPWVLIILSGFFFLVPHLANPEFSAGLLLVLFYFMQGAFLAFFTLKDDSLELAIGIHAANNIFNALFVTYASAVLTSPTIFANSQINVLYTLITTLIAFVLMYIIVFRYITLK